MGNLIRSTALLGYRELVCELGGDPDLFLARFGIPRGVEKEDDAFISFAALVRLLEAGADELGCPDFGLRLSRWHELDVLGPIAVIARNSRTLLDAMQAIARYLYVHSPAIVLRLVRQDRATGTLVFAFELHEPGMAETAQGYEIGIAVAARIVRLLGGPEARLSSVSFRYEQQGSDEAYREAFGCAVRFKQASCSFELSARLADRPIENADPEAARIAAKYLESKHLPPTAPLADRVAQLARGLLSTGQCSLDEIASEMAVHPRTLQRQLAADGMRCQDVIDRERRARAKKYLAQPELALSQVAGLLGYTEQSALNRSCRRWFGKTPRQYRLDLKQSRSRAPAG